MAILFRATGKLLLTFLVTILLFLLMFAFLPQATGWLEALAEFLRSALRAPGFLDARATALYNDVITTNLMMGVVMAAIARVLIEAASYTGGVITGKN